jgi:CRP-like cAMP-binding protein
MIAGAKTNITVLLVRIPDADAGVDMLAREVNLKIDALAKMPFFRFLAYQELVRVLNMTEVRTYQIGDEIVKQGQEGDELFIVLTGQVRVHTGDAIITRLGAGQHFGEMAMVDKAPRSASVSADDPTKLLVISPSRLLRNYPQGSAGRREALVELRGRAHRTLAQYVARARRGA